VRTETSGMEAQRSDLAARGSARERGPASAVDV
jgi:hypothetical protein